MQNWCKVVVVVLLQKNCQRYCARIQPELEKYAFTKTKLKRTHGEACVTNEGQSSRVRLLSWATTRLVIGSVTCLRLLSVLASNWNLLCSTFFIVVVVFGDGGSAVNFIQCIQAGTQRTMWELRVTFMSIQPILTQTWVGIGSLLVAMSPVWGRTCCPFVIQPIFNQCKNFM